MSLEDCVVSVSGMRGLVGSGVNPELVCRMAAAYGRVIAKKGKPIIVGRDSRPHGELFARAVTAGLQGVGCDVIDIGIVPTPTVPICCKAWRAGGGIQISASHNSVEWNALKFFAPSGRNIDGKQLEKLLKVANSQNDAWQSWDQLGSFSQRSDAHEVHIKKVLSRVDVAALRKRKFTVLLDSVNGAGSQIGPRLLDLLGCEVIPLYNDPSRIFPREPEPSAENVKLTGRMVKAAGADIGFIQDPDADRLAIIDEKGNYIGEEYTLVLCAAAAIENAKAAGVKKPVVCTNLSTSRMLEDVAAKRGGLVIRSSVGEANVVDAMQKHKAVLGGEGNGGIIDPKVVAGRDSQAGMALVLAYLLSEKSTVSESLKRFPSYGMHKEKVALSRAEITELIPKIQASSIADRAEVDTQDGLKLIWPDRWIHIRASGTEPVSRIISEAPQLKQARALAVRLRNFLWSKSSHASRTNKPLKEN